MTISTFASCAAVVAALAGTPSVAAAQTAPTPAPTAQPATDICSGGLSAVVSRPTQTTSVCTVKPNSVLIETGYQSQTVVSPGGSFTFQTFPNATIRVGTALRNVEVQVIPPGLIRSGGGSVASDIGAGLKWQIASTPSFAYGGNVIVTAPTGTDPAKSANGFGSANTPTYVANANIQGSLGKVFGYGATFSVQRLAAPPPAPLTGFVRYTSVVPSVDMTASLPANWGVAVEVFNQSNGEGPATPSHTWFDAAISKGIGKAQFDVSYGVSNAVVPGPGLPSVRRFYVGAGVSYGF